jgi:DNA-binding NtrC family response regulator
MDLALQAKLLHVLEDGCITRVGGNQVVPLDVRIMATTNKPLEEAIAEGEFRKDLYFRLKVIRIEIPPLRERRDDIPLLCDHFLRIHSGRQDSGVTRIPDRLMSAFLRYPWPGNVRELDHVIQRYVILPDVEMVLSELEMTDAVPVGNGHGGPGERAAEPYRNGRDQGPEPVFVVPDYSGSGQIPLKSIAAHAAEEAEKRVVLEVLRTTRWNRKQAAKRLDICYKTLLNKLERWDMEDGADRAS